MFIFDASFPTIGLSEVVLLLEFEVKVTEDESDAGFWLNRSQDGCSNLSHLSGL